MKYVDTVNAVDGAQDAQRELAMPSNGWIRGKAVHGKFTCIRSPFRSVTMEHEVQCQDHRWRRRRVKNILLGRRAHMFEATRAGGVPSEHGTQPDGQRPKDKTFGEGEDAFDTLFRNSATPSERSSLTFSWTA